MFYFFTRYTSHIQTGLLSSPIFLNDNWIVQGGWREDPIQRRTIHWIENFPGDGGVLELKCTNIWFFLVEGDKNAPICGEQKKNLVDKKIGIEIGLSDATIVIWTASFFVCNSLSVQWPTNNCFSNSNDIIGRKNSQRKRKLDIDFLT